MAQLQELNGIEFHDLPVLGFRLQLEVPFGLSFDFATYNEQDKNYDLWTLNFTDVKEFSQDGITIGPDSGFEIYSFEYKQAEFFEATLLLLTGFGRPSATIRLKSTSFELKKFVSAP